MSTKKRMSFLTYWPADYVSRVKKAGDVGSSLEVVFGGGHTSFPAPSTYGAAPGDLIYPVTVIKKVLHIIARLEIAEIMPIRKYAKEVLKLPKRLHELHLFELEEQLLEERPELGHRMPHHCISEAVIGNGSYISYDCQVPAKIVTKLRLENRKGEQRPISHVENGEIKRSIGLQQHCYRLSANSSKLFADLVGNA